MGLLNKVKNLFFEEEYVEVEEKPKKTKKDVPIAKKIELPKVEKVEPKEEENEEIETFEEEVKEKRENKFPMHFDTEDFKEDHDNDIEIKPNDDEEFYLEQSVSRRSERYKEPVVEEEQSKEEVVIEEVEEEEKYDFELEYGKEQEEQKSLYEGKNPKKTFTPTPIISPIYGILDKNYTKDDVVTKKEIRLSTAHRKADLDAVREKAYGDLTSDITQSMEDVDDKDTEEEKLENTLYDLNDENTSPAIESVTVGDAEEYFNDLGLEYNIDYEDTSVTKSKEKETTKEKKRRSEKEEVEEKNEKEEQPEKEEQDEDLESNLFDLIESMYDEKE